MPQERKSPLESIGDIFRIPDLRNRILFTLGLLAVYRLGAFIAVPGINHRALEQLFQSQGGTLFGLFDLFAGGNLRRFSIFALGVMPYVTAAIILELATVVVPSLEKLSKEGELGRRKITQYTRYLTVLLTMFQSFMTGLALERSGGLAGPRIVYDPGLHFLFMVTITLTTGTAFVMWMGEQISDRGIGNGISLIIFAGIVVGLPHGIGATWLNLREGTWSPISVFFLCVLMLAVVTAIVYVERAQRKIPVQYAKRVLGRRIVGGQVTFLPLRINTDGVIPVIFAASIISIPSTLGLVISNPLMKRLSSQLAQGMPLYTLLYALGIIFFTFFYVSIIFNPVDVADNIRKYGGYIPGIRPGRRTAEYIDRILSRLTAAGALYLTLVCLLPGFLMTGFRVQPIPFIGPSLDNFLSSVGMTWVTTGLGVPFYFGGTSLLIVVGVAMDTVQQVEAHLIMRHYDSLVRRERMRGVRG